MLIRADAQHRLAADIKGERGDVDPAPILEEPLAGEEIAPLSVALDPDGWRAVVAGAIPPVAAIDAARSLRAPDRGRGRIRVRFARCDIRMRAAEP